MAFREKNREITSDELSYLTKLLKKGWKILDLACGYGRLAIPLASMGYSITGIDLTPVFIDTAKREANNRGLKIDFEVGNMTKIPCEDRSFDLVICMWNAFSELAVELDQLKSISEMKMVLRSGGIALIEVRNHRPPGLDISQHKRPKRLKRQSLYRGYTLVIQGIYMDYTTIQISRSTREKLNGLRAYKRMTYDELLNALMSLIPEGDDEGVYTEDFRASLLRGLLDVKEKKTHTAEEVKKQLGIQ